MFRTLAALLLVSSGSAWAQSSQVAEDQKQLHGIWRVCEVIGSDEAKAQMLQMLLAFEGNTLMPLSGGEPTADMSYSLNPLTDPKQIDLMQTMPQIVVAGQKPPARQQVIVPGIYALEGDRLKLHLAQGPGRRPADFSTKGRSGAFDCVFILERDTSPTAQMSRTLEQC